MLTRDNLDRDWWVMFLHCKNSEADKEVLTLFAEDTTDENEWSEQDIYEQIRRSVRKFE